MILNIKISQILPHLPLRHSTKQDFNAKHYHSLIYKSRKERKKVFHYIKSISHRKEGATCHLEALKHSPPNLKSPP